MPLIETVGRSVLRCCTEAATAWQAKPESKMYHFILAGDVCVRMNERLEAESTTTWNERLGIVEEGATSVLVSGRCR